MRLPVRELARMKRASASGWKALSVWPRGSDWVIWAPQSGAEGRLSRRMKIAPIHPLTALRGIAAWWVVIYHFRKFMPVAPDSPWMLFAGQGFLAVDLFFVLSGFVLQINYGPSLNGFGAKEVRDFAVGRLARVYPLH